MKTKKVKFFLLSGMLLLGVLSMSGQSSNLYIYTNSSPSRSVSLDDFQKLTFTGTELIAVKKTAAPDTIAYTDLRFFTLKENITASLEPNPNVVIGGVNVYPTFTSDELTITGNLNMTGVGLYDLQGRKLLQINPVSQKVELSLAAYPTGVYLLHIVDDTGITVKKIIKN